MDVFNLISGVNSSSRGLEMIEILLIKEFNRRVRVSIPQYKMYYPPLNLI